MYLKKSPSVPRAFGAAGTGVLTAAAGVAVAAGGLVAGIIAQSLIARGDIGPDGADVIDGVVDGSAALLAQALTAGILKPAPGPTGSPRVAP